MFASSVTTAHAQVTATVTTDNAYSFGYGGLSGLTTKFGDMEACTAAQIFSCGSGAEVYTSIPGGPNQTLYIIAYSDDGVTQGVLGTFVSGSTTVLTGVGNWEVFATGIDIDPNCAGSNAPSLATINAEIVKANTRMGGAGSSVGWVGVGGGPTGFEIGELAVGEPNDTAGGTFPQVCVSVMGTAPQWMWYNPDPSVYTNPFAAPAPPGEFLIFRLLPEITSFCFGDGASGLCPCGNNSTVGLNSGCLHSQGGAARLVYAGTQGASLKLLCTGMPFNALCSLQRAAHVSVIPFTAGDGLSCLSPGAFVFATQPQIAVGGTKMFLVNPTAFGQTRYFQVQYRDAINPSYCTPSTLNYSNAIAFGW
ncbi:MAG: hypothetical protein ACKVWV_12285 [Planctomycetota bacterium]